MTRFGKNLRAARLKIGRTQNWMAKRLNIDRSTYSKYETQNVEPDFETLYYIGQLVGVPVDELIKPD